MSIHQPLASALAIDPPQMRIVQNILRQHVPERLVWAFGSRATGQAKPYSDLDLAIIGSTPLGIGRQAALAEAFSDQTCRGRWIWWIGRLPRQRFAR